MPKWTVTNLIVVEVEAEDSVTAESKLKSIVPTTAMIQKVGKIIRTLWSIDTIEEVTKIE